MSVLLYFALAVVFAGIVVERILEERAWKSLTAEERAREADGLSGVRTFGLVVYVLFYAVFLVALVLRYAVHGLAVPAWVLPAVLGFLLLAGGWYQFHVQRRVRALAMPQGYRRALSWSQGALDVAVVVGCVLIAIHLSR